MRKHTKTQATYNKSGTSDRKNKATQTTQTTQPTEFYVYRYRDMDDFDFERFYDIKLALVSAYTKGNESMILYNGEEVDWSEIGNTGKIVYVNPINNETHMLDVLKQKEYTKESTGNDNKSKINETEESETGEDDEIQYSVR